MPYRWKLVALLFCCAALNYADRASASAVFPLFRATLGITDLQIAAVGSLFLWSYGIGSPFAGLLAGRVSRSRLIVASLAAWSLVTLCTSLVTSVNQLLLTRVLLGLAECIYLPAAIALIADHHPPASRASAISIHTAGLSAGLVGGGAVSGYLGEHWGWHVPFASLGAAGLALTLACAWLLHDDAGGREGGAARKTGSDPVPFGSFAILVAAAMFSAAGMNMFTNWLPLYLRENHGLSLAGAGFSGTFLVQFPGVLGALLGGFVSDRAARRSKRNRMFAQSVAFALSAPALILFLWSPPFTAVVVCVLLFGLMRAAGVANESPLICDLLEPAQRSTAIGVMNATNCLAGGIGIFAAGALKSSYGLETAFAGISALMLAASALTMGGYLFVLGREFQRREASPK